MTESEELFHRFCKSQGWRVERIDEHSVAEGSKVPDFRLQLGDSASIVVASTPLSPWVGDDTTHFVMDSTIPSANRATALLRILASDGLTAGSPSTVPARRPLSACMRGPWRHTGAISDPARHTPLPGGAAGGVNLTLKQKQRRRVRRHLECPAAKCEKQQRSVHRGRRSAGTQTDSTCRVRENSAGSGPKGDSR